MTKNLVALLALVVSIAFAPAKASASTTASTPAGAKIASQPATQTPLLKASAADASANSDHTFQVNDEKGLLLTCVAPQIDTDPNTDLFKSCALAPGRTLDDAMHTFIRAIHFVQNKQLQERDEWYRKLEERSSEKAAQK